MRLRRGWREFCNYFNALLSRFADQGSDGGKFPLLLAGKQYLCFRGKRMEHLGAFKYSEEAILLVVPV